MKHRANITIPNALSSAVKTAISITSLAAALTGCFGSSGSSPSTTTVGKQLSGTGTVQVSGRINSSTLPTPVQPASLWPTASPDSFTIVADEVALSADGVHYTTVVGGPIQLILAASSDRPIFSSQVSLPAGTYQAVRLKIASMEWHATWDPSNRSPCTGVSTGEAQGAVPLNSHTTYYFKTSAAGGNTQVHYSFSPKQPFLPPNYIGDANNPLLLAAPLVVPGGTLTTMDMVIVAKDMLTCSSVTGLSIPTDHSSASVVRTLAGPQTLLSGAAGVFVDSDNNRVGVLNAVTNTITSFDATALAASSGDLAPVAVMSGPATRLKRPEAVAWYHDPTQPADDEIVVANAGNESIDTYAVNNQGGNVVPVRVIRGVHHTELSDPAGLALWIDPNQPANGQLPTTDEIWVTDRGSNEVAAFTRLQDLDVDPLYRIRGPQTELNAPCGIALSRYQGNERVLVTNSKVPGGADLDRVTIYDRSSVISLGQGGDPTSGDVPPLYIIEGDQTGLSSPCGIAVDDDTGDIYVANQDGGTVTVYARASLPPSDPNGPVVANIAPVQVIGSLSAPHGLLWDGAQRQLWVAQRGALPAMARMPHIASVASDGTATASASPLNGKYNVVVYGLNIEDGSNRLGYPIAVPFSERGTATFNPGSSGTWPNVSLTLDQHYTRRIIDRFCDMPVDDGVTGFYDTTSLNGFNMFLGPENGVLSGAFSDDGEYFLGASLDPGRHLEMMIGIKHTGSPVAAFGASGTTSYYNFAQYGFQVSVRRYSDPSLKSHTDILRHEADAGTIQTGGGLVSQITMETGSILSPDPMGDWAAPRPGTPMYSRPADQLARSIPITAQPGGELEIQSPSLGWLGIASKNGDVAAFMGDAASLYVDNDSCPTKLSFGIALRAGSQVSVSGVKGKFQIVGLGDNAINAANIQVRPTFRLATGSISFDGTGGGSLSWTESDEGNVQQFDTPFIYRLRQVSTGGVTTTAIDLLKSSADLNPIAILAPGPGFRTFMFYSPLQIKTVDASQLGNPQRLVGMGIYVGQ